MPIDDRASLLAQAEILATQFGARAFSLEALSRHSATPIDTIRDIFTDEKEVLTALALRGVEQQRNKIIAAVSSVEDPTAKLLALARSIIRNPASDNLLSEIHKMPSVGLQGTAQYVAYAIEIHAVLVASARTFTANSEDAFDLLSRVIAVARGTADLHQSGMLADGRDTLAHAEAQGERMVRVLIQDAEAERARTVDQSDANSRSSEAAFQA